MFSPGGLAAFLTQRQGMADNDIAEHAFERAWRVYRLMHGDLDGHGQRRATLDRFIKECCDAGATDPEKIVVEALKYLKRRDELREPD